MDLTVRQSHRKNVWSVLVALIISMLLAAPMSPAIADGHEVVPPVDTVVPVRVISVTTIADDVAEKGYGFVQLDVVSGFEDGGTETYTLTLVDAVTGMPVAQTDPRVTATFAPFFNPITLDLNNQFEDGTFHAYQCVDSSMLITITDSTGEQAHEPVVPAVSDGPVWGQRCNRTVEPTPTTPIELPPITETIVPNPDNVHITQAGYQKPGSITVDDGQDGLVATIAPAGAIEGPVTVTYTAAPPITIEGVDANGNPTTQLKTYVLVGGEASIEVPYNLGTYYDAPIVLAPIEEPVTPIKPTFTSAGNGQCGSVVLHEVPGVVYAVSSAEVCEGSVTVTAAPAPAITLEGFNADGIPTTQVKTYVLAEGADTSWTEDLGLRDPIVEHPEPGIKPHYSKVEIGLDGKGTLTPGAPFSEVDKDLYLVVYLPDGSVFDVDGPFTSDGTKSVKGKVKLPKCGSYHPMWLTDVPEDPRVSEFPAGYLGGNFVKQPNCEEPKPDNPPVDGDYSDEPKYEVVDKPQFCHATGKPGKFVVGNADVNAFFKAGHHTHQDKRDIVKPFSAPTQGKEQKYGKYRNFIGLNWTPENETFLENGCKAATEEPAPTNPKPNPNEPKPANPENPGKDDKDPVKDGKDDDKTPAKESKDVKKTPLVIVPKAPVKDKSDNWQSEWRAYMNTWKSENATASSELPVTVSPKKAQGDVIGQPASDAVKGELPNTGAAAVIMVLIIGAAGATIGAILFVTFHNRRREEPEVEISE